MTDIIASSQDREWRRYHEENDSFVRGACVRDREYEAKRFVSSPWRFSASAHRRSDGAESSGFEVELQFAAPRSSRLTRFVRFPSDDRTRTIASHEMDHQQHDTDEKQNPRDL